MTEHLIHDQGAEPVRRISPDELKSRPPGIIDRIQQDLAKPAGDRGCLLSSSAMVVMTVDGGPIRTVITGRRVIPTGVYSSRKAGRALPFESMNEQTLMKHSEVDTHVVDYRSQPFRFEFVIDGAKRIYIADCARLLDDGTVEVVEVKGDRTRLDDPDYAQKIEGVREICEKLGWRFRLVTRRQLHTPEILLANVESVQFHRNVSFDQAAVYSAAELVDSQGGEAELGTLADRLANGPRGMAIAQALMVARVISIDLTTRLSPSSRVTLIPPSAWAGRHFQ